MAPKAGASSMPTTVNLKFPDACSPRLSVAVTLISNVPTWSLAGVPLKVRWVASNETQSGSGEPSARVAT